MYQWFFKHLEKFEALVASQKLTTLFSLGASGLESRCEGSVGMGCQQALLTGCMALHLMGK